MSNYETAKLVRSVVSDRDLIPVMTHFHMYLGRLQGTNGKLTLDGPWPEYEKDEPINIPAEPFVRAFEAMDNPNLQLRDEFIYISEKKMKVRIPLSTEVYPACKKPEEWHPMDNTLLESLRKIQAFISNDASRPWACGALYLDGYLYATNNIVIVRTPWHIGSLCDIETFTLPGFGIDQLMRCGRDIIAVHVRDDAIGFELEGDVWMESVRYVESWPDIQKMFEGSQWDDMTKLSGQEVDIVEKLLPFVPDKRHPVIKFEGDKITTMEGAMEASIEVDCDHATFHSTPLLEVLKAATHMNFSAFPKVPFKGRDIEGIIAGVHV